MSITGNAPKAKDRKKQQRLHAISGSDQDALKALRVLIEEDLSRHDTKMAGNSNKKKKNKNNQKQKTENQLPPQGKAKTKNQKPNQPQQNHSTAETPKEVKLMATTKASPPTEKLPEQKAEPPPKASAPSLTPFVQSSKKGSSEMNQPNEVETKSAMPTLPELVDISAHIVKIAQRSQKVLAAYMARKQAMKDQMPSSDPIHLGETFSSFIRDTLSKPDVLIERNIAFWQDYVALMQATVKQMSGQDVAPVISPARGDKRFKDEGWQEVWVFNFIKQSYLLTSRWMEAFITDSEERLPPKMAHKLRFYSQQMIDAIAPTNFWITNPEVLRTTIESHGENLIKGLENLLSDFERGHGQLLISMSDSSKFTFGDNIASTKGKVVFQNELFQLIQFSPTTETVHKTPFLVIPPWINKYYILDLKPQSSFIRYLVDNGHTTYVISWANPDKRHAKYSFEDYMEQGPVEALRQIGKITGEKEVNCLGYCIGGTLLACMTGWMAGLGDKKPSDIPEVKSSTYLVALVDFEQPGDLGVFIDEEQIQMIEKLMEKDGYLPASHLATTFSMLRANDLIWSFVVNNYLMGKDPFPFDLLTWNSDSTNLPASMQSFYLRNMYLHNRLVQPNALTMKGVPIDLTKIKIPTFLLGTVEDHITLWRGVYKGTQQYSGKNTFCLSGSGHIAGVVNPPAKEKYSYWTNNECPADPEDWLKGATEHKGSWWPEWVKNWLSQYAGPQDIPAAQRDPANNPNAIEDAPGSYVKVRVL